MIYVHLWCRLALTSRVVYVLVLISTGATFDSYITPIGLLDSVPVAVS